MHEHRERLFRLCYRMTGSAADADDLVQETFVRALDKPPADRERDLLPWLVHVAMNLSRDHLRWRKRQPYKGTWLPSPIETEGFMAGEHDVVHPEARYGELESVSLAFLIALEALSASQRAVLILRDVLGYSVEETASALELSASNVKTTHHRARAALASYDQTRVPLDRALQEKTRNALHNLLFQLMRGDAHAVAALLARDVVALNDGNGEYLAARSPVIGPEKVARFHLKTRRAGAPLFAVREINGLPALVAEVPHWPELEAALGMTTPKGTVAPRCVVMVVLDRDGKIRKLDTVVAPPKLSHMRFDFLSPRAPEKPKRVSGLLGRARKLFSRHVE